MSDARCKAVRGCSASHDLRFANTNRVARQIGFAIAAVPAATIEPTLLAVALRRAAADSAQADRARRAMCIYVACDRTALLCGITGFAYRTLTAASATAIVAACFFVAFGDTRSNVALLKQDVAFWGLREAVEDRVGLADWKYAGKPLVE